MCQLGAWAEDLLIPQVPGMAFRPYIPLEMQNYMAFHKCSGYPQCRLQILSFLWEGCTSRSFCEVEVHFFNVSRMVSLPIGISSSTQFFLQEPECPM